MSINSEKIMFQRKLRFHHRKFVLRSVRITDYEFMRLLRRCHKVDHRIALHGRVACSDILLGTISICSVDKDR